MKFGMRKPSLKRSISARTTGKAKRAIKNPQKAAYNKVYRKTTFSLFDLFK